MGAEMKKGRKVREGARGRREREWKRHRAEIIEAAEGILLEKGYHGASMQDIAERAEFAVGTLYKFFRAKDELYEALFEEKVKEIEGMVKRALESSSDPVERIVRLIEVNTEIVKRYGGFFHLYMSEVVGTFMVRPIMSSSLKKRHKRYEERIAGILKDGMDKGLFRRMNPRYAAMGLIGLQRGFGALWVGDEKHDIEAGELTEMVKEMFFGGMLTEDGRRMRAQSALTSAVSTTNMAARGGEQ